MIITLFWVFIGLSLSSWLFYPLLLLGISLLVKKQNFFEPAEWPDVSVLIAARNEENTIEDRILNLLSQNFAGNLEIIIGSDASVDRTEEIVRSFQDKGVILYSGEERMGKPLIIQKLVELATGTILVFTDADTAFTPDTIKELVIPFSDTSVTCVDGSRRNSLDSDSCESIYWKYEVFLKLLCSKTKSVLGATGAVFALQKESFHPLTRTRADDFELAVMARIDGNGCVYNPKAIAIEPSPDDVMQFTRMMRITSWMSTSCFLLMGRALSTGKILLFLQLLFHKLLRWVSGIFLIAATVVSFSLAISNSVWGIVFLLFCLFHASALLGYFFRDKLPAKSLFPYYYWLMNGASIIGIFKALAGSPIETWERK